MNNPVTIADGLLYLAQMMSGAGFHTDPADPELLRQAAALIIDQAAALIIDQAAALEQIGAIVKEPRGTAHSKIGRIHGIVRERAARARMEEETSK